jgi:RNA polymerase sigma factor (sigma-70 family)
MTATETQRGDDDESLGRLLAAWQAAGDLARLEPLLAAARPLIERTAARSLRRHGVADPAAIDDVVSRVFDHLRRLPGGSTCERFVACFVPRPRAEDAGHGYVVWLTSRRSMDVVRDRRRCHGQARCFAEVAPAELAGLADARPAATADSPAEDACCRLRAAVARLDPRQRLVVELLLDGKSQAVIAHAIDVCEGTVSRLRSRAIESLRRLLDE